MSVTIHRLDGSIVTLKQVSSEDHSGKSEWEVTDIDETLYDHVKVGGKVSVYRNNHEVALFGEHVTFLGNTTAEFLGLEVESGDIEKDLSAP